MKKAVTLYSKLVFFAVVILVLNSCGKETADSDMLVQNGIALTGQQEVPPVATTGSGQLHLRYIKSTRTITYTIIWNGLTSNVTAIKFNGPASPGSVAKPVIELTGFPTGTTGSVSGDVTVDEAKVNDLLNDKWYLNIHTTKFPNGEIRGQVTFD